MLFLGQYDSLRENDQHRSTFDSSDTAARLITGLSGVANRREDIYRNKSIL